MIIFLTQQVNNDVWEKLFSFVVTTTMIVFDLMMEIKIPLTNVSLFYVLIFTMVVELSIYAIRGTSTSYNELGSTVKNNVSQAYSRLFRTQGEDIEQSKAEIKQNIYRFSEYKQSQFKNNKQQLLSLAGQAKIREQSYRRLNK